MFVGRVDQLLRSCTRGGERLLHQDVLARCDRPESDRHVRGRRGSDDQRVDVRQRSLEIGEGSSCWKGPLEGTQSFFALVDEDDRRDTVQGVQHANMFGTPVADTDDAYSK